MQTKLQFFFLVFTTFFISACSNVATDTNSTALSVIRNINEQSPPGQGAFINPGPLYIVVDSLSLFNRNMDGVDVKEYNVIGCPNARGYCVSNSFSPSKPIHQLTYRQENDSSGRTYFTLDLSKDENGVPQLTNPGATFISLYGNNTGRAPNLSEISFVTWFQDAAQRERALRTRESVVPSLHSSRVTTAQVRARNDRILSSVKNLLAVISDTRSELSNSPGETITPAQASGEPLANYCCTSGLESWCNDRSLWRPISEWDEISKRGMVKQTCR